MANPRDFITFDVVPSMEVTYFVDNDTWAKIKDDPDTAIGKTVTLTGPATVGFGTANDKLLGIIGIVEKDACVRVCTGFYAEGVNLGTTPPSVGQVVKCDGDGGLVAASSQTQYGPTVIRIDAAAETGLEADTAVIKF